jgi:hypothetical protein
LQAPHNLVPRTGTQFARLSLTVFTGAELL